MSSTAASSPPGHSGARRASRCGHQASETEIARSRVTAPIDGEILKLNVRAGARTTSACFHFTWVASSQDGYRIPRLFQTSPPTHERLRRIE
jgi:hypothetical protein